MDNNNRQKGNSLPPVPASLPPEAKAFLNALRQAILRLQDKEQRR